MPRQSSVSPRPALSRQLCFQEQMCFSWLGAQRSPAGGSTLKACGLRPIASGPWGVLQRLSGGGGEGRRGISIQERKANLLSLDKIFSKMHTSVALSTMDPGFGEGSRTSKVTPVTHKECPKCRVMFGRQLRKCPIRLTCRQVCGAFS